MWKAPFRFWAILVLSLAIPGAVAAATPEPVLSVGAPLEGIAFSKRGDMYLTVNLTGEILRYDPKRHSMDGVATLGSGLALGLAISPNGAIYAALASFDPATNGVYSVDEVNHTVTRVADIGLAPNALVFDEVGNLYITESIFGMVYRLDRDGNLQVWSDDSLLVGNNPFFAIGANGIAYGDHVVYVMNYDRGSIVAIPVQRDGSAGAASVFAQDDSLIGGDGIALDVHGNIYVAGNLTGALLRVNTDGEVEELASGMERPASVAFGTAQGAQRAVFVTAFGAVGVYRVDVGVPGRPLH